jgi:hypothetical protein
LHRLWGVSSAKRMPTSNSLAQPVLPPRVILVRIDVRTILAQLCIASRPRDGLVSRLGLGAAQSLPDPYACPYRSFSRGGTKAHSTPYRSRAVQHCMRSQSI